MFLININLFMDIQKGFTLHYLYIFIKYLYN